MIVVAAADPAAIEQATSVLRRGGVVAYPTDTTYALGVSVLNESAVTRLALIKRRAPHKSMSVAVSDIGAVASLGQVSERAMRIVSAFLPGPLTVVLPALPSAPRAVVSADGNIGVRIPGHAVCLALLGAVKCPLTATSANPRGDAPALSSIDVMEFDEDFRDAIDLLIDDGQTPLKQPSTVIAIEGDELVVIREGAIPIEALRRA